MPLSAPTLVTGPVSINDNGQATSITSASFTPVAGTLLIVVSHHTLGGGSVTIVDSISSTFGYTWTKVEGLFNTGVNGADLTDFFYTVVPASPVAGTVTVSTTGGIATATNRQLFVYQVSGITGTTPVIQGFGSSAATASRTVNFASPPASSSLCLLAITDYIPAQNPGHQVPTSNGTWTSLYLNSRPSGLMTSSLVYNTTAPAQSNTFPVTVDSGDYSVAGIEISAGIFQGSADATFTTTASAGNEAKATTTVVTSAAGMVIRVGSATASAAFVASVVPAPTLRAGSAAAFFTPKVSAAGLIPTGWLPFYGAADTTWGEIA